MRMLAGNGAEPCRAIIQAATSKPEARERFANLVLDRFSGLMLSHEGESFLDVRPADGRGGEDHLEVRTFNVRSMIEASEPKLYVIHLDAIDGPFITMVVNLLMAVATRYSVSTRARTQRKRCNAKMSGAKPRNAKRRKRRPWRMSNKLWPD
ncbi:hypothetical protein AU476_01195 [Cupriavidus sp. UYMSc13B]|nr:hypothetical protein AU476_01195 [Cupriavidus sp. UYMSc13B]